MVVHFIFENKNEVLHFYAVSIYEYNFIFLSRSPVFVYMASVCSILYRLYGAGSKFPIRLAGHHPLEPNHNEQNIAIITTNVHRQKYKDTITTKILRWIHINISKTLVKSENPFRRFLSFILDVFLR